MKLTLYKWHICTNISGKEVNIKSKCTLFIFLMHTDIIVDDSYVHLFYMHFFTL